MKIQKRFDNDSKLRDFWEIQEWSQANKLREVTKVLNLNAKASIILTKDQNYYDYKP